MRFLFILSVALMLSGFVYSQPRTASSVVHDFYQIKSAELGEEREILVHVPLSYSASATNRYPVVYMLDGHTPHPEMMAGIIANQSEAGKIPKLILVSIRNVDRLRDMTPTKAGRDDAGGGVEKFLDFIENEVIPLVEKNYRTVTHRIFAGHSLAGLTVVHTLINRPDMFDSYIAASPVLHWDGQYSVKQAKEKLQTSKIKKTIFLGLGDEPDYQSGWRNFQKVLKDTKDIDYEFRDFDEENHLSVVLPVYHQGLRKIFAGWEPTGSLTAASLRNHYKDLSKRFGYTILTPEGYLNAAGYRLMQKRDYAGALFVFKENTENYPESSNAFDSLGECYEKMGNKQKARESYEESLKLAEKGGNALLVNSAKARLAKLR